MTCKEIMPNYTSMSLSTRRLCNAADLSSCPAQLSLTSPQEVPGLPASIPRSPPLEVSNFKQRCHITKPPTIFNLQILAAADRYAVDDQMTGGW